MLNIFITKGELVFDDMEFRESFLFTECKPMHFGAQIVPLAYYRGSLSDPEWVDEDECKVSSIPPYRLS